MQCFVVHNVLFAFDKLYCFFLISFSSFLLCLSFFRFFFFCFTSELFTLPFFLLLCLVSNLLCLCFIYILFLPCKSLVCFHTHLQTSVQSLCILTVFLPSQIGGYLLTFFKLYPFCYLLFEANSCALPLDPHCSLHIFYLAHFLSPESDDLDADLSRLASLGFTGCLSVVHFNTISPLKEALLRPNSSPVIITGPLAQSNCGSAASANSYSAENTHHLSGEKRRRHLTCYYVIIFENINM